MNKLMFPDKYVIWCNSFVLERDGIMVDEYLDHVNRIGVIRDITRELALNLNLC